MAATSIINDIQRHYIIAMKARRWDTTLYELAGSQAGYFTAAQARVAGLHPVRLTARDRILSNAEMKDGNLR
jgi:hypothetical protein